MYCVAVMSRARGQRFARMASPRRRSAVGGVDSRPPRVSVVCSRTIGKVRTSSSSSEGRSWICRCRCGANESPESPTAAIRCPRVTDWPARTSALPRCRCSSTM